MAVNLDKSEITASHYDAHADKNSYEDAFFYEPGAYMTHLVELTKNRMQLDRKNPIKRRILDIGGGTGNFAEALIRAAAPTSSDTDKDSPPTSPLQIIVVDPFLDPTTITTKVSATDKLEDDSSSAKAPLQFVKASAEDFLNAESSPGSAWWRTAGSYHQILMKEIVHHLNLKDRVGIFRGMYQGLAELQVFREKDPNNTTNCIPSLLIVTRPQIEIDYPLWEDARQVWRDNQPSVEELVQDLHEAGFQNVQHTLETYPCSISLQRWQSMVQNRCWSTFSNFTDEELLSACARIASDYQDRIDDDGNIHFEDRLVFLTACK
jgi:hypothetical protein